MRTSRKLAHSGETLRKARRIRLAAIAAAAANCDYPLFNWLPTDPRSKTTRDDDAAKDGAWKSSVRCHVVLEVHALMFYCRQCRRIIHRESRYPAVSWRVRFALAAKRALMLSAP